MTVTHVLNVFGDGAIPNILFDLRDFFVEHDIATRIVSIEPLRAQDTAPAIAESLGFEVVSLNCGSRDLRCQYRELQRFLVKERPALLHSHTGRAHVFCAMAKPGGTRLVTTFHSVPENFPAPLRIVMALYRRRVDAFTGVSRNVAERWSRPAGHDGPVETIYNPLDRTRWAGVEKGRAARARYVTEFGLPRDAPLIVHVGRLRKAKGQADLLRAMTVVRNWNPDAQLLIAGNGPEEQRLRDLARSLNIEQSVQFLGFRTDAQHLMAAADCCVFPSLWEGLGLVVLEAVMVETPVVCTEVPAFREMLDETGAVFVPQSNPEALGNALISVLTMPEDATFGMTRHARTCLGNRFDPDVVGKKYQEVYERVLRR